MAKSPEEKRKEAILASHWDFKFKQAMVAKAPFTKAWNTYFDAYKGDYFKKLGPDYKSNLTSNYVFSIIETIRPIMLDNDPKFQSMPRTPEGMPHADDLNKVFAYEWDRERLNTKLYRELINCLVTGNYFFFVPWDSQKKEIKAIPVNPFNIFVDPIALDIDSAEYVIYADYYNENEVKRRFPSRKDEIEGDTIKHSELLQERESDRQKTNQVLILEVYSRDHEMEIDKATGEETRKFPNGRVTVVAPELGLVLEDKANPYKDGRFPFVHGKDYDVPGQFWGNGEVEQLLSPQNYMNEMNNAIIDNAKATANMPWIVDSNSGVPKNGITNRPGLIIRKRPGTEVRRDQPPSMPAYVSNAVEGLKHDMEQVSGIFDTLKGNSETGVYTAQGILALQEAGQARIRLKVKLMEDTLGRLGELWFSRMRQFWRDDRFIRIVQPDGSYDFKKLLSSTYKHEYDIRVMAGSTMAMNRNAMLDLMIRLAQTQMPDGQPLVDREAVVEYLPQEVKNSLLRRSQQNANAFEQQLQELTQFVQEQAQASQQFQQEIGQTLQQLTQEMRQNDQQTIETIKNIVGAIEKMNGEIVAIKQEAGMKQEQDMRKQADQDLQSKAYDSGYKDAQAEFGQGVGEGLAEGSGVTEAEGVEVDPNNPVDEELPEEILEGLEALSEDELELLQMSDPTVSDLL
jgi:hypothetical protein